MLMKLLLCARSVLGPKVSREKGASIFLSEAPGPELKTVKQSEQ